MSLPLEIYSVAGVRALDRAAIEQAEIPGYQLMTRAGQAAFALARERYPDARRWQVVCGGGNNGGDGYVVARLAAEHGIAVSVLSLVTPDRLTGDAERAWMDFAALGGAVAEFEGLLDDEASLLVDALLGSGLQRNVAGRFADVVDAMNGHGAPILALDIPSGVNGDDGSVMGTAVRADATMTFVGLKSGLLLGEGRNCAGALYFDGLDIPEECRRAVAPDLLRIDAASALRRLGARPRSAHKGDFGHVLVIGGGPGMAGAARLCGEAALRAGAGLVSVATHPSHAAWISAGCPELMCHGIDEEAGLGPLIERANVIAIGPGLGTGDWSRKMFEAALGSGRPLVVDADGLNLLAGRDVQRSDWVLTPHPGEAARLAGATTAAIQQDRRAAVVALQASYGGVAVLKGAGTLVADGDGIPSICAAGNPGMASPGMGDTLTGIIAAFAAQGLSLSEAARAGVGVHAAAGDRAARAGERGLLASDLIAELRACVNP